MTDHDPGPAIAEPQRVGERLRAAREAQGLTTAEVGARTRIPLRHLEAIEAGDYTSLPSPTYAVGFARAYARLVGVDEVAVARDIRSDLDRLGPRQPEYVPYETADPARVPSRGVAIAAAGIALALLILVALYYGTNLMKGGTATETATPAAVAAGGVAAARPTPAPSPTPSGPGQVTLTANDEVWLRVYDAANKTLFQGTMKAGDKFDVPPNAADPQINVGRPDKLSVTLNGSAIPPLGDGSRPIKNVRVSAEAVQSRLSGQPATTPSAAPTAAVTAPTTPRARPTTAPRAIEPLPAPTFAAPTPAPSSTPTP